MYTNPFIYKRPLQPGADDLITIDRPILLAKALAGLKFGHWYLVCGGKKIGKTSFLLSLMHECRRRDLGYHFTLAKAEELQQFHLAELYAMICQRLAEQFPERALVTQPLPSLYDFKETLIAVAQGLPADEKIVIVLDSMDTLPKYLLQEFFRGLLHLHQLQATNKPLAQVQFIIGGMLNTNDMQFEHGHSLGEYAMRVMLEDFRLEDFGIMMRRVAKAHGIAYEDGFSRMLYEYTSGAGYLVQKICYRLLERAFLRHETPAFSLKQAEAALESIVKEGETNVEMVITQIEKDSVLVECLMHVVRVGTIGSSKFDPNLKALVALGALTEQNGFYRVRNRIYENVFRDYFTTERLANLYFSQQKYERAKDLIAQATTEQVDAKNALQALLGNIQTLGASLEHGAIVRGIIEAFINVVDSTKNCSLMLLHPTTKTLRIADAIGLSTEEVQNFELALGKGVAGWVAQAGRYRVVRDVTDEIECPDFVHREAAARQNLGAMACFPIKAGGSVVGVISLCLVKPRSFSSSEIKMLEALAAYAALALQNTRLHENHTRFFDQLAQVRALVQEAGQHTELDSIIPKIIAVAKEIMEADQAGVIYRTSNSGDWLFRPAESFAEPPAIAKGESIAGRALQSGRDSFCESIEKGEHCLPMWKGMKWEWAIPCNLDNEPHGCLVVAGEKPVQLTPEHRHLTAMLADAVTITLRNKRLFGIAEKTTQQVITAHVIGETLSHENSLQEILNLIAAECLNVVGRDQKVAFVWIKDSERRKLILKAAAGEAFGREEIGRTLGLQQLSLVVSVLNERRYRLAPEVSQCEEYRPTHPDIKSEFAIPLVFREETLGVIDLQSLQSHDFDERDLDALLAIAQQAAVAIKVVTLCDIQLKELQSLYDLGTKISSTLNAEEVLRIICREGLKAIGAENRNLLVQLLDPATQMPAAHAMRGVNANLHKTRGRRSSARESWVIANKQHYLSSEVSQDSLYQPTSPQIKSALFMPIVFDNQVVGLITMESVRPDDFGEAELRLIKGLANQAGIALANARLNENLAKAQVDLAKALETAAIEEVVAGLTHDIKGCSSLIAGETQWLAKLEREHKLHMDEVKKALLHIDSYVKRIEEITGGLKNRAYRLPPQLRHCNLRELVDEAVQMIATRATRQSVEIHKDLLGLEIQLDVDHGRLVRAIFNLLTNALDAMPEGGTLQINAKHEGAQIRLAITDSGAGIPEELHNKVLQAGVSTKKRGYGLGLALTKRIVEVDHRGKLNLHSRVGEGTTIEVCLPLDLAKRQNENGKATPPLRRVPARLRGRNAPIGDILVVNDDVLMLEKITRFLRSAGHRVLGVESGKEAVLRCRENNFEVIVLDYHLRKDDSSTQTAVDFVPDLKRLLPETPIILTSASLDQLGTPEMFCDFFLEINPSFWRQILDFVNQCLAIKLSLQQKRIRQLQTQSEGL